MTPDDLVEIEQIRQLKARYFRLMDQKKWDEWASRARAASARRGGRRGIISRAFFRYN